MRKTLCLLALLPLVLLPLIGNAAALPHRAPPTKLQPPIAVALTTDGRPGLQRTVRLTAQVTSQVQAEGVALSWILPAGTTLAGEPTAELGSIAPGQTLQSVREITFDQVGTWHVAVHVETTAGDPPMAMGHTDDLYFTIRPGPGSSVSTRGPGLPSAAERIATPNVRVTETAHPEAGYWVRGRFLFEEVPVTSAGAGTPVLVPARQVKIKIMEDDLIFDDHDGTTYTDDDGYFEFWVSDNDDGWFGGDKETYLEIYANSPGAYVTDRSWIDEDYYCYTGNQSGGHDIDFGWLTPTNFHRMFSIADALLTERDYVLTQRDSVGKLKVQYEPGYGEDTSFYDSFWDEVTIADAAGDDGYDDGVAMHEYGHWFAANYACDDSDGGHHSLYGHYDNDLAWSEGWASYLSSAARNDPWYLDWDFGSSSWSVSADWETWSGSTGSDNESAVVATLWDIHDSVDETHDRLSLGGDEIWHTFDDGMEDIDDCTIYGFWDEYLAAGYPDDSELAAIFAHYNTAGLHTLAAEAAAPAERRAPADAPPPQVIAAAAPIDRGERGVQPVPETIVQGGLPWNAVLFLPDATNSMAGEIAAVRQIIQDKVNDMHAEPFPYEYTVETFRDDGANHPIVDHFFPDVVNPPVAAITVGGGGDAEEDSFAALSRGTVGRLGYDAWLFTDAAPKLNPTEAELEGLLQTRQVTPYFFIFGDCTGGNLLGQGAAEGAPSLAAPGRPRLPRFEPEALEDCVEPYLLVAGGTDGQFLLIDTSQIDDAAEIVRAFMSNNAGAGRYSNYVSTSWAYSWDDTGYAWYDATGGTYYNTYFDTKETIALPAPFPFFDAGYSTLYAADRGYVSFSNQAVTGANTGIPTLATPNNAIYAFWDQIGVYMIGERAPDQCTGLYTDYDDATNRFVVEYCQAYHQLDPLIEETFEIILDYDTGQIILQYQTVDDDSSCTYGVENAGGTLATQIGYNNPGSLYDGRAIVLTPLPPHPSNDHQVIVDSTMEGVIFLLNGYSGDVDMTVYRPGGAPVNPGDPGVVFMDVGRVKYYRIGDPEPGTWIARASGNGTYYFTSSAASPLDGDYQGDTTMSSWVNYLLLFDLGMPVNSAAFNLIWPDGSPFGTPILYDDGSHGDGAPGDGLYGGSYNAPGNGTVYLQVDGQTLGGEAFRRVDQTPLRFQGMELITPTPAERFALPGATVIYTYTLWNDSDFARLFAPTLQSSQGWATTPAVWYYVAAHDYGLVQVTVHVPGGAGNVTERTTLTMVGAEVADSGTVLTTVRGWPTTIEMAALPGRIGPDGRTSTIMVHVQDDLGWNVADGTLVDLGTDLGTVVPMQAATVSGLVTATLISDAATGTATVEATAGAAWGQVIVEIAHTPAYTVSLAAGSYMLPPDGTSTTALAAYVFDEYGAAAPDGTEVVFAVGGDEMALGSIAGSEIFTATATGGVAIATYQAGTEAGLAQVYAGIPLNPAPVEGEGRIQMRWTGVTIVLGRPYSVYLPLVIR